MTMSRLSVAWQNWPGAPGVSQFYFGTDYTGTSMPDAVRTFFNSLVTLLPTGLTIQVPNGGDLIEETTGNLSGTWTQGAAPAVVTGTGGGSYAGNAGSVVHWLSDGVVHNRRVRGRTFLVPLIGAAYETNGSLSAATITTITNAAQALRTTLGDRQKVWARPFDGTPDNPPRVGSMHPVTGHRVPDLAISLRSRRV